MEGGGGDESVVSGSWTRCNAVDGQGNIGGSGWGAGETGGFGCAGLQVPVRQQDGNGNQAVGYQAWCSEMTCLVYR